MKVAAVASSPLPAGTGGPLKAVRPGEAARCGPVPGVSPVATEQAAAALLYDMKGCYSRLRALVPTLPRHRRVSKVELLQHVIDYIWDLQLELQCGPPRPAAAGDSPEVSADPTAPAQTRAPDGQHRHSLESPSPDPRPLLPGDVPFSCSPSISGTLRQVLTALFVSLSRRLRAFLLPIGSSAAETALDLPRTSSPGSRSHHGHRPWDPVPEHRGSPASLAPQPGQGVLWAGSFLLRLLRAFPVLYITMILENIVLQ